MPHRPHQPVSGHVFRREGRRGGVWYAKYRLPDGRQVKRRIGPAAGAHGRPSEGAYTERTAQAWLDEVLVEARRGELPGMVRTGATFADAAAEFMRRATEERGLKPSTLRGYRSIIDAYLLPAFGERPLEQLAPGEIERWRESLRPAGNVDRLSNHTRNRILILLHGILARACKQHGIAINPAAAVERAPARSSHEIQVLSPEEVRGLVRAAASPQDAALYLTAAFTGLRMGELIALRWRDIDEAGSTIRVRASYSAGALTTPKSGKVRAVPLAPDVAQALDGLRTRGYLLGPDDLVFLGDTGSYLDGSALRRRYKAALTRAGLRPLRFHDLRHTFGTRVIAHADIRRVQEWMGHADIQTTMRYLHYAPRPEDARLVGQAFASGSKR